jgi:Fuc2NAc and GlcNAc transferase
MVIGLALALPLGVLLIPGIANDLPVALAVGCLVLVVAAIGWIDDHRPLAARWRLMAHCGVGALVVLLVGLPGDLTVFGLGFDIGVAAMLVLASLGTAWTVNLCNFMDGIDGLLAGVSACILLAFMGLIGADVISVEAHWQGLVVAAGGASLGFLWWNQPRAKIFMGDVGSTVLGLLVALTILLQIRGGLAVEVALLPASALLVDASATLVRRVAQRERLSSPHRTHIYQRLARRFSSHGWVTSGWIGATLLAILGQSAVIAGYLPAVLVWCVLGAVYAAVWIFIPLERD